MRGQALFNLIDDEEDMMALQTAAGAPREEWELCFEYYLQSGEDYIYIYIYIYMLLLLLLSFIYYIIL